MNLRFNFRATLKHVLTSSSPIKSTWLGGATLASDHTALQKLQVTRQEYQEYGAGWVARVFSGAVQKA
jgi:actin-related protein 6